ncbi:MAG: DUF296 domain-containing protein [Lentisphaerae bacterium]|nr:DUF296 domain-containing protein [Lentisphaerota bacterium]
MQVTEGSIGRIFVLRLEDGDKFPDCIEEVAKEKRIESGLVFLVGGAKNGKMVTGPVKTTLSKPDSIIKRFSEAHEIMGVGTIFLSNNEPSLHLHAACGRGSDTIVGCTRPGVQTYLVAEVVILEMTGINAMRKQDPLSGFDLLNID